MSNNVETVGSKNVANKVDKEASLDGVVKLTLGDETVNCRVDIERLDALEKTVGQSFRQLIGEIVRRGPYVEELYAIVACMTGKHKAGAIKFINKGGYVFDVEEIIVEAFSLCTMTKDETEGTSEGK